MTPLDVRRRRMIALNFAMMEEMKSSNSFRGEICIMDIHKDSFVTGCLLENNFDGTFSTPEYGSSCLENALPVVLPAATYLVVVECGGPEDIAIDDAPNYVKQYVPDAWVGLTNYLYRMRLGYVDYYVSYEGIKTFHPLGSSMICWMNKIARGDEFIDVFEGLPTSGETIISTYTVRSLQNALRKNVECGAASWANSHEVAISGLTGVSRQDDKRIRSLIFCGYFPSEAPKYGIYVHLKRKEQIEDVVMDEWPELGQYPSTICKEVAEALMKIEKEC